MSGAKKAEGLSLQVIVIAAIALIVLLVVLGVFKGGIDRIVPSLNKVNECPPTDCKIQGDCKDGQEIYGLGCDKFVEQKNPLAKGPYCCKKK